jgi:sulfur carrier protein ThiS
MLAEALTALASTGGSALVTAMVTDGWEVTRTRFARLLGHGDANAAEVAEERLERSRLKLESAPNAELERVRAEQEITWRIRLEDLLVRHPEVADTLKSLLDELNAGAPGCAVRVEQHVLGFDHAQQATLGHGVQHVNFGGQPDAD